MTKHYSGPPPVLAPVNGSPPKSVLSQFGGEITEKAKQRENGTGYVTPLMSRAKLELQSNLCIYLAILQDSCRKWSAHWALLPHLTRSDRGL